MSQRSLQNSHPFDYIFFFKINYKNLEELIKIN